MMKYFPPGDLKTKDGNKIRYYNNNITEKLQQVKLTRGIAGWENPVEYTIVPQAEITDLPNDNRPIWLTKKEDILCLVFADEVKPYEPKDTKNTEILFQILFGLYQANATYGITLDPAAEYKMSFGIKDETKRIGFALQIFNDDAYDYFEFQTNQVVLIEPDKTEFDKQADFNRNLVQFLEQNDDFKNSSTQAKTWADAFVAALKESKQDYGSGIEWGLNLALFHPIFKDFYKGEKKRAELPVDTFIFANGHRKDWFKESTRVTGERDRIRNETKDEVDKLVKQARTYKLEDFRNIVLSLLTKYDKLSNKTTRDTDYPNENDVMYDLSAELQDDFTSILNVLKGERKIDGLGKIPTFTKLQDTLADPLAKDTITPWGVRNIDYGRARGYTIVLLSIIGKIVKDGKYQLSTSSSKETMLMTEINATGKFDEPKWNTDFNSVFVVFDDQFRGAANKVKALKAQYQRLRDEYDNANFRMNTYKRKQSLEKKNLDEAKAMVDALNETNVDSQESVISAKLKEVDLDASLWRASLTSADLEHTRINTLQKNLDDIKAEWAKLKTDYQKEAAIAYAGSDPAWPVLQTVIDASDFAKEVDNFTQTLQDIHDNEIKTLKELLKEGKDLETKKKEFDTLYAQAEKAYTTTNAISDEKRYNEIWSTINNVKPDGLSQMENTLKNTILAQMRPLDKEKKFISAYETKSQNLATWIQELTTKASQFQRNTEGAKLQQLLDAIVVTDASKKTALQQEITDFKNNTKASRVDLNNSKDALETKIKNLQKQAGEEKLEEAKKDFPLVITQYDVQVENKTAWTMFLENNTTEIKKAFVKEKASQEFLDIIDSADPINKSRVAAAVLAKSIKKDESAQRKMLAYSQMF